MSAQDDYDAAMRDIRKGLTAKVGGTSAENRAATAYSQMVREGSAPPLRRKHRVGRHMKMVRK